MWRRGARRACRRITSKSCERVLRKTGRELDQAGLACLPAKFGDAQLDFLLNGPWRPATEYQTGLAPVTRRYLVCIVNGFLKESGNLTVERRRLRFPRSGVRPLLALTPEEAARLLDVAATFGIVTHAVVAFELLMGLRRSEVRRLTVGDFGEQFLRVRGKGRAGGKIRIVPYHPEILRILPSLLEHRRQKVQGYRGPDPGVSLRPVDREGTQGLVPELAGRADHGPGFSRPPLFGGPGTCTTRCVGLVGGPSGRTAYRSKRSAKSSGTPTSG